MVNAAVQRKLWVPEYFQGLFHILCIKLHRNYPAIQHWDYQCIKLKILHSVFFLNFSILCCILIVDSTLWKKERMIEVTRRRWWHKQLPGDVKDKRGYCKSKMDPVNRTLWQTRLGSGYGYVVRYTGEWTDDEYLVVTGSRATGTRTSSPS